jgi:hypothetical protein
MNRKRIYTLKMTEEEEKGLLEIIGNGTFFRRVGEFIGKLYKRGDLIKK